MARSVQSNSTGGRRITRQWTAAGGAGRAVSAANRWRENYNAARGLTMRRVVDLLEAGQRGDTALLQWTYATAERRYSTLNGLLSRCEAPLTNFDWTVRIKEELPEMAGAGGADGGGKADSAVLEMAERQRVTLRDAYERVDNLREAIRHLHLAEFRGYAHLQKHRDANGDVTHLEPLNQWCVCRDGLEGDWFWNPEARMGATAASLGEENRIGGPALPLEDFIIQECARPIDEVGLRNYVRSALCDKNWDGFVEIYGIPGGVVVMPPNVPQGRESEYEAAAKQVAEGGSGAIPSGADYKANDGPRGVDPFTPRLNRLDAEVVLVGTGGKLTMMAESGSGTLAGGAHQDTFTEIAAARAKTISERFQRDFDAEVLARKHPGEPALVYFVFGVPDRDDEATVAFKRATLQAWSQHATVSAVLANLTDIKETVRDTGLAVNEEYVDPYIPVRDQSGGLVTGDVVRDSEGDIVGGVAEGGGAAGPGPAGVPFGGMRNREGAGEQGENGKLEAAGRRLVVEALASEFAGINERLAAIAEITDPELQKRKLAEALAELDRFERDLAKDPAVAGAIYKILAAGLGNGLAEKAGESTEGKAE